MQLRDVHESGQNFSNMLKNIHIETLGCRLNQIESEAAASFFIEKDFKVFMGGLTSASEIDEECPLVVINTCTVTQKSEQKARRIIRLSLKKYPCAAVLVTGCYAQLSRNEIKSIDSRICVLGGQIKSRIQSIPVLLKNEIESDSFDAILFAEKVNEIADIKPVKINFPEDSFKLAANSFIAHSRASLKIQDGCNSNCSYCAIHMARGHSVSIPVETALKRVKALEENGHSEVIITTVNIGQYKSEYNGKVFNFTRLLDFLLNNTKKINFRISSLYPEVVDEEFCEIIKNPRVRPHFHISVQSGSNRILKAMNRVYDAQTVENACKKLREARTDCFLACDIITGFPGETEDDFLQTFNLCKTCDFSWIHAFPYSERPGTAAAIMKNKVPNEISGKRAATLTQWVSENKINYIQKFVGKELPAIVENVRKPFGLSPLANERLVYHAVTENFIHCEINSRQPLAENREVRLKIVKPLTERIKKGGETEALAEIVSKNDRVPLKIENFRGNSENVSL